MRIPKAALAATTLTLGVAAPPSLASPVQAASETVVDPLGDTGPGTRLDVVRATVANDDRTVVARVAFAKDVRGDVIVSLDPRGDTGVRLVATKRRDGTVTSRLLPGAFTDRRAPSGDTPACRGLRVRWAEDVARLAMPSRCLHGGDYGAVRFSVLTENGADSDVAPDRGTSGWIPRG